MTPPDPMDTAAAAAALNDALSLQQRSVLHYTTVAGSLRGLAYQGLAERLATFARAELEDARRLVEKVVALGADPTPEVRAHRFEPDPSAALDHLVEAEEETIAALHAVIPESGQEPRSEALEHLLEHLIMRKQEQLDWLVRARGR